MARYFLPFPSSSTIPRYDPHDELLASLSRLTTVNPPVHTCSTNWTFHGFYTGPTSIAYLFFRLSHLYPELEFKSQSLLDWSLAYLELGSRAIQPQWQRVDTSHCGIANETLCQLALRAVLTGDRSLVRTLCSFSSMINDSEAEGSNEWLYGRAGYLYLLRMVLKLFPDVPAPLTGNIEQAINSTVSRILSCSFPWKWHHRPYLGAVHGSIGIITQILLSTKSDQRESLAQQLRPLIENILSAQLPSGNFPPSHSTSKSRFKSHTTGDQIDDRLVQFCHGSPGVILSLNSILQFYSTEKVFESNIKTAISLAQKGLIACGHLTKSPCLCHGIPSNALAISDEEELKKMLGYMSTEALEGELGTRLGWMENSGMSDDFAGLFTGEAGRAWVWGLVDCRRKKENGIGKWVLGFNDL
jgi:Lanthionine synthetase C-like protein